MDKNTLCLFCLEVSDEEYYQAEATGTISELSKKISLVEEDLNYFTKHVLIYTDSMDQFSQKHVGEFEEVCRQYIVDERFDQYKKDNRNNCEYDFLLNLFIKLPFLRLEKYRVTEEKKYRTVTSFVQEELKAQEIDISEIQSKIEQLEEVIEDENAFYKWLDSSINEELQV